MKKLPNQLSNDELLKQLAERPKEEEREISSEDYHNDVLGFAAFFQIEAGEEFISTGKLYKVYKQWSKEPVSQRSFARTLSTFIARHYAGYLINQKVIKLSVLAHKMFVARKERVYRISPLHQKRFVSFLARYKLKKGVTPIPLVSLHYFYREFIGTTHKKAMNLNAFTAYCKLHFHVVRDKREVLWVKLTKSVFEVFPREQVLSILESHIRERDQKTKDQKTKKQISEPRSDSES